MWCCNSTKTAAAAPSQLIYPRRDLKYISDTIMYIKNLFLPAWSGACQLGPLILFFSVPLILSTHSVWPKHYK